MMIHRYLLARVFSEGIKWKQAEWKKVSTVVMTMKPVVSDLFHSLKLSVSFFETIGFIA